MGISLVILKINQRQYAVIWGIKQLPGGKWTKIKNKTRNFDFRHLRLCVLRISSLFLLCNKTQQILVPQQDKLD